MSMVKAQAQHLLDLASCLREAAPDIAQYFNMRRYGDGCDSPACALGHYAARGDMQQFLALNDNGNLRYTDGHTADFCDERVNMHFGITPQESSELFDTSGCNNARTTKEAATYVEKFLDEHGWAIA